MSDEWVEWVSGWAHVSPAEVREALESNPDLPRIAPVPDWRVRRRAGERAWPPGSEVWARDRARMDRRGR